MADDSTWEFFRLETANEAGPSGGESYRGFEMRSADAQATLKAQQFYKPNGADIGSYATRATAGTSIVQLGDYTGQAGFAHIKPSGSDARHAFFSTNGYY